MAIRTNPAPSLFSSKGVFSKYYSPRGELHIFADSRFWIKLLNADVENAFLKEVVVLKMF